jgi:hypothetical protein
MKKWAFARLFLLIILFPLACGTGCGVAKSAIHFSAEAAKEVSFKILPGQKAILKKKVLISPVMNQADVNDEKIAMLTQTLEEMLAKEKLITHTLSRKDTPSRAELRSPQFGVVIDPDLVKEAEKMGMNVLVTCILNPFEVETKKSGIWPLRRVKREIVVSISLNAIDITYGTLFLNKIETGKFKIHGDSSEPGEKNWDIDDEKLDKEFVSILDDLSSDLLNALNRLPWSGRIELAGSGTIKVNGGSDIGITEGSIFEVFGKREEIRSVSGKSYYLLGPKDGEIRIEKVSDSYSMAVPLNDKQFVNGQIVRLKR